MRNPDHIEKGDVPLAALDLPGIISMDARELSEPLLREALLKPQLLYSLTE